MSESAPLDLARAGAGETARAIAAGQLSARDACDAAIERIERHDGAINAVVVRDFDRARAKAAERDARCARGERPPLIGVPMTVKESLDMAGLPTTWGLRPFRDFMAQSDAVVVERLEAAGAVVLGKTNVPPGLADWQSTNPIYGRTVNPHDRTRSPGGSSGGSAAAVASGMVPLEVGSDIGGSIRVPAVFCGVFGHKPTFGLVPARGHGFPRTDGAPVDLAVVGPIARSAEDLALALDVLAGPDGGDAAAWQLALPPPRPASLAECRLLCLDEHPAVRTEGALRDAVEGVAVAVAQAGAKVERKKSALLPDLGAAHGTYVAMLTAVTTRAAPGPEPVISAHEWFALVDAQFRLRRAWRAFFAEFDAVIAPAFGTVAYPHVDSPDMTNSVLTIDGEATRYGRQIAWPGVASLPGLPATALPVGTTREGLPVGVQVICGFLQDRAAIAIAGWLHSLAREGC